MLCPAVHDAVEEPLGSCCQSLRETMRKMRELRALLSASTAGAPRLLTRLSNPAHRAKPQHVRGLHLPHDFICLPTGYFSTVVTLIIFAKRASGAAEELRLHNSTAPALTGKP